MLSDKTQQEILKGQQAVTFMAKGGEETQTPGFMSPVFRVLTKNCLGTSLVEIRSVYNVLYLLSLHS